ncbi:baseplate J/gp47 family protein [Paenibacillus sp. 481]|uniref:baseplate J/gp47 family protein n=1 Tax=Paenibacillus sp. 481 TaxID=2835869 RepID=UPI001E35AC7E|nr:baseplate J/gp47 family protein [Paenibacillus sp. 481]UHA73462.1 baseplate J/gp47 family protein [Paenibacillus sp. 481]
MKPPKIGPEDAKQLIEQIKRIAPYYTPEWKCSFEDPDAGTALMLIFADMFEQNSKRLNQVPYKNFIAFLNMLGISFLPPKPAQGYVTFELSTGAKEPVLIPEGTQVTGKTPDGTEDVIFETTGAILATPAEVVDAYNVSPDRDYIARALGLGRAGPLCSSSSTPFTMFQFDEGANMQAHTLYLAHRDLLLIRHAAVIQIVISNSEQRYLENEICTKLGDDTAVQWAYGAEGGWVPFDEVTVRDNRIFLHKKKIAHIIPQCIAGTDGMWIKCTLHKPLARDGAPFPIQDIRIDGLKLKSEHVEQAGHVGIAPDFLFFNDIQLTQTGGYPFGEYFAPYAVFYIGSCEVFSKKEGKITLQFQLQTHCNEWNNEALPKIDWKPIMKQSQFERPEPQKMVVEKVRWEYWDGESWVKLFDRSPYEDLFCNTEKRVQTVVFDCPPDLKETVVNSRLSCWIRVRILHIDPIHTANPIYFSPWVEDVQLFYEFKEKLFSPDVCLTSNNAEYADRTVAAIYGSQLFQPFAAIDCEYPAFYMGFAIPPMKGPISLYFSLQEQRYTSSQIPVLDWEYTSQYGSEVTWRKLKTIDTTESLTRSGTIQFAGPPDFAIVSYFGQRLYWIRAVNRDRLLEQQDKGQPLPIVKGIYLNTARVMQQESIRNELTWKKKLADGSDAYVLEQSPVISEEVWINETGHLTESEIEALQREGRHPVQAIRDSEQHIQKCWVAWLPVDSFADSGWNDRHYVIHRAAGHIRFGDGIHGKMPPNAGPESVKVHYRVGGGRQGNLDAFQIINLKNSIAFIQSVYNPQASGGGSDTETMEEVLRRGPNVVKHRNRAIAAQDFEWLAREACPNIHKVKCLANYNANLEREPGCITVVVITHGGMSDAPFFPELKKQVETYLLERTPSIVAFPDRIQVIQPAYLEVSVSASLFVTRMESILSVEEVSIETLNRFLDPVNGNYDGKGWSIGEMIHESIFYGLLKAIRGVSFVSDIALSVVRIEYGQRTEADAAVWAGLPHRVIVNGKHRITVNIQ